MTDDQIAARLTVLEAGAMWVSIATLGHGLPVLLVDVNGAGLDQACINVAKQLGLAQLRLTSTIHVAFFA